MSPKQAPSPGTIRTPSPLLPLRKSLATEAQNGPGLEIIFLQPLLFWHLRHVLPLETEHLKTELKPSGLHISTSIH